MPIKYERSSRKQRITTGLASKAIRGELDQRYGFARVVSGYLAEYRGHCGPDRSVVLDDLCRSAAVHKTVANMNLTRLREAITREHPEDANNAYEVWRTADREHREVARLLGVARAERPVPTVEEYLAKAAKKKPLRLNAPEEAVSDAEEVE